MGVVPGRPGLVSEATSGTPCPSFSCYSLQTGFTFRVDYFPCLAGSSHLSLGRKPPEGVPKETLSQPLLPPPPVRPCGRTGWGPASTAGSVSPMVSPWAGMCHAPFGACVRMMKSRSLAGRARIAKRHPGPVSGDERFLLATHIPPMVEPWAFMCDAYGSGLGRLSVGAYSARGTDPVDSPWAGMCDAPFGAWVGNGANATQHMSPVEAKP